jgi:hypothetical protein
MTPAYHNAVRAVLGAQGFTVYARTKHGVAMGKRGTRLIAYVEEHATRMVSGNAQLWRIPHADPARLDDALRSLPA